MTFDRLPESKWPTRWKDDDRRPMAVWLSDRFQVTLWQDKTQNMRLSINLRERDRKLMYKGGITWDELQKIKSCVGFGDWQAVEIYPPDKDVVYKANVRHLWLMHHPLTFQWKT